MKSHRIAAKGSKTLCILLASEDCWVPQITCIWSLEMYFYRIISFTLTDGCHSLGCRAPFCLLQRQKSASVVYFFFSLLINVLLQEGVLCFPSKDLIISQFQQIFKQCPKDKRNQQQYACGSKIWWLKTSLVFFCFKDCSLLTLLCAKCTRCWKT